MGAVDEKTMYVDVICVHQTDGHIIPLRIRIRDEDGEYQKYTIKGYRDLTTYKEHVNPYGLVSSNNIWTFECLIQVFNSVRHIFLYFNSADNRWRINDIF